MKININLPNNISLAIKREDLLHPHIPGNKWRKLKYNLIQAKEEKHDTLLTFGGAFSNHIAATAAAGKEFGFRTIGIIRGEELEDKIEQNPTLAYAKSCGMQFKFISRSLYREKGSVDLTSELEALYGSFYLLSEGGTNALAVKGCEEILDQEDSKFDYITCAVGTGGTVAGIVKSALPHQKVLGFPALKANLLDDISKFVPIRNLELVTDYHFGGYAKVNEELIAFINDFYSKTSIPLDPVYTGKMVFGVIDMISRDYFPPDSQILLIHTGGLQGIEGMNRELLKKGLPIIKT